MAKGILAVAFDFASTNADEFHDWYDLEHLPERQAIAGFGRCERWLGTDEPQYAAATYDLETIGVLKSPTYMAVGYENSSPWTKRVVAQCTQLLRFEGEQLTPGGADAPANAGGLLINAMNVTAEGEEDFNAWYDQEHLPALGSVPGCLAARRYRSTEVGGGRQKYLAIYHVENPDVVSSNAWAKAVDTPWSARVRPHFRDRLRIVTGRYGRKM
jgi:hypothetical protein